jgi:putative transposase
LIQAEKANFPVAFMCRMLKLSRSGYYAWEQRPEAPRAQADRSLKVQIQAVHQESRGAYGSPRVYRELRARGHRVGRHRIARIMKEAGIAARTRRRFVRTTQSNHGFRTAPNVLKRRFNPPGPNRAWAGDITYISTKQGWLYLAVVLDLYSRRVVGWAVQARMGQELTQEALEMALSQRAVGGQLVHHSDRGVQYAATSYRQLLKLHGIRCSMSRKGNCWDNAVVESFFSTLKTELVYPRGFHAMDHDQAKLALFDYIEAFYNSTRRHSALDYQSPIAYEEDPE